MRACPICETSVEGRKDKVYCCERCRKKAEQKRYNKKHGHKRKPQSRRKYALMKMYGITPDDYKKMFVEQEGCCAICGIHQQELKVRLAVDHNHDTGEVRGLLCRPCNTAIGLLKEDKENLLAAIRYLE